MFIVFTLYHYYYYLLSQQTPVYYTSYCTLYMKNKQKVCKISMIL